MTMRTRKLVVGVSAVAVAVGATSLAWFIPAASGAGGSTLTTVPAAGAPGGVTPTTIPAPVGPAGTGVTGSTGSTHASRNALAAREEAIKQSMLRSAPSFTLSHVPSPVV